MIRSAFNSLPGEMVDIPLGIFPQEIEADFHF